MHRALLCEELLTADSGGMDLKEGLLSSAVPLFPSPMEHVVSSSWGTSQLNPAKSSRQPQQEQPLSQLVCASSPTQEEQLTSDRAHEARGCSGPCWCIHPLTARWHMEGAALSEPVQSAELYKEPQCNSSSVAFHLAGSDGGRGCPFFCYLSWDFQCVIFFCAS